MPTTIRSSSYVTNAPTSGASMTIAIPAGTTVGDMMLILSVNGGIGVYDNPGFSSLSYDDPFGEGISWFAAYKNMTTADIAAGSFTFAMGFPTTTQAWGVIATDGPATVKESPTSWNFIGVGGSQDVVTSAAVSSSDTAVLMCGVVANVVPAVTPGTSLGVGSGNASVCIAYDSSMSSGVNTFHFSGGGSNANFQIAVILGVGAGTPLAVVCDSPPAGVIGSPYSHLFPASGGTTPYSFSITSGSLPTGLTLNSTTGSVTGTPTANGVFPFTVGVTDAASGSASVSCSITISPGASWVIQEITAELIPSDSPLPGAGHYRYTVRCVDQAQAGTYLGFWGSFGGGDGGTTSASSIGGGELGNIPSQPNSGPPAVALSGVVTGSQPEINFIPGPGVGISESNDTTNSKVDVTISATGAAIGGVSLHAASYTLLTTDAGELQVMNSGSAQTFTLPASPPASPWLAAIQNIGAGTLTIDRNGNTIDAAASNLTLAQGQGVIIFSNGTAYYTERGMAASGTVTSVALTVPSWLTVSGSPVTGSGTLAITGTSESANLFLASPNGSSGAMTPRAIVPADLPVATTSALGVVKPDGSSITISGGVISAVGGGGGVSKYSTTFTATTSLTVTHSLGTTAVIVQVYDPSGVLVDPESVTVTSSSVVTITFGASWPPSGSATVVVIG